MFHVYFGVFDVVLYAIAIISSLFLADAICGELEVEENVQTQGRKEVVEIETSGTIGNQSLILSSPIFELNGTLVVKRSDLPIGLPEVVKSYSLRGDPAVRIQDLQNVFEVVAIDARQMFAKWEQWKPRKQKRRSKKKIGPLKEAEKLRGGDREITA